LVVADTPEALLVGDMDLARQVGDVTRRVYAIQQET